MCFFFMGTDVAHQTGVSWDLVVWDLVFRYKSHCVCTGWHSGTYSVHEAPELVGEGGDPDWGLARFDQVAIFERCARRWIDDGIDCLIGLYGSNYVTCNCIPGTTLHW